MNSMQLDAANAGALNPLNPVTLPGEMKGMAGTSETATGNAFAQLFEQLHLRQMDQTAKNGDQAPDHAVRQEFAADALTGDEPTPLVAWTISPQLEVITPDAQQPSPSSLQAFAKAQGLDEATVSWLFQAPLAPAANSGHVGLQANTASATSSETVKLLGPDTQVGHNAHTSGCVPTPNSLTSAPSEPTLVRTQGSAGPLETTLRAADVQAKPSLIGTDANPAPLGATLPAATEVQNKEASLVITAKALASLQPTSLPFALSDLLPEVANPSAEASPTSVGLAPALMPAQMQLMRTSPGKFPMPATPLSVKAQNMLVETLDLDAVMSELVSGGQGQDAPSGTPGPNDGLGISAGATPTEISSKRELSLSASDGLAQKLSETALDGSPEKIKVLAERLGQAIGERLVSAMERGQWQLKLMLKPAHLGHVEVEMRMRSGELDASFMASQAATRELLREGMGRLKATLSNLGMDVASMQVEMSSTVNLAKTRHHAIMPRPTLTTDLWTMNRLPAQLTQPSDAG